jgi:hypothetical protein
MILAPCRCLDCDPQPIQARLFSHALVENTLGGCVDCGQPATKLLVGGAGQPDTSLCGLRVPPPSSRRRWPRPGQQERARWGQRPSRGLSCVRPGPGGELSPQRTAFFTSAAILASSAAVNSVSAKAVGHMAPSSRFAASWKPNVEYLELYFCALWKKQTTLPSLA